MMDFHEGREEIGFPHHVDVVVKRRVSASEEAEEDGRSKGGEDAKVFGVVGGGG